MTGAKPFIIIVAIIIGLVVLLTILPVFLRLGGGSGSANQSAGSLLKTEDSGGTWKILDKFPGGEVSTINFDSTDKSMLLVGTRARGVWSGKKTGEDWNQYPGGVGETSRIFDLIEPVTQKEFISLVLFNKRGRIVKLLDGNRSELFFTPIEGFAFISGYRVSNGYLRVIGSDGGFYESRNQGVTWRSISRFRSGLMAMAFDPLRDNEIWVLSPQGSLYKSQDGGNFWTDLTQGLRGFQGYAEAGFIYFDTASGVLYHGSKHGLLRSFDGGKNWERVELTIPPESLPPSSMAVAPKDSLKIYLSVGNIIYSSKDGGISWKGMQIPGAGVVSAILINPDDEKEIFVGMRNR